ncbi:MAG: Crp/Fnr family transcriptional regulator [Bacteroidota bacterium]
MKQLLFIQPNELPGIAAKKLKQAGFSVTVQPFQQDYLPHDISTFDLVVLDSLQVHGHEELVRQLDGHSLVVVYNPSKLPTLSTAHLPTGWIEVSSLRKLPGAIKSQIKNSRKMPAMPEISSLLPGLSITRKFYQYKKKQVIYAEGHHPCNLLYIEKGKVKIFKKNNEGKELTIALLTRGDYLGYAALLEESVYKDSAQAMEDTEITGVPREEFEVLMNTDKSVAKKFIRLLATNVSEQESQLLKLAYNSLRKRVAEALMNLVQKYKTEVQAQFSIHISREELANMVGTATESLIRTLSDFKHEKLIQIKAGNIIIADGKKLRQIAEC